MAELKKRLLTFSSGKQVRLYGNSIAIGKSMEIGEGYAPTVFSYSVLQANDKNAPSVSNPHGLTKDELLELADYQIRLWMDFKDGVRKHGISNARLFNKEGMI